jgi:hypothetical protein
VDQLEPRRERPLVVPVGRHRLHDRPQRGDELGVRGGERVEVPGAPDQPGVAAEAVEMRGVEPLRPDARVGEQRVDLRGGARGDPGAAGERAVPEEPQVVRQPGPGRPPLRRGDDEQVPAPRGVSAYAEPRRSRSGRSQPWRTIREIAVRTAGAAMPTGASNRTSVATGATPPRVRRWSPYRSNRAERACMSRACQPWVRRPRGVPYRPPVWAGTRSCGRMAEMTLRPPFGAPRSDGVTGQSSGHWSRGAQHGGYEAADG